MRVPGTDRSARPFGFSLPPEAALAGSLAGVAFLGITDYLTGWELSFSIFYLAPISFATLSARRQHGLVVAVASAAAWLAADLLAGHRYSNQLIPYWNGFVRLVYFVLHATLLWSLTDALTRQQELAGLDALTGVANLRRFQELGEREAASARRTGRPLTACFFDLDQFKSVNDKLGHAAGDELLRAVAQTVQRHVRPRDLLGRLGGDEFALLLPETGYQESEAVLRRLATDLLQRMRRSDWPVTVSMGAVTFLEQPDSFGVLLNTTDLVMYTVKKAGGGDLSHHVWPGPVPAAPARSSS